MGDVPTIVRTEAQWEMRGFPEDRTSNELEILRTLTPARLSEEAARLLARTELIDVLCGPDVRATLETEEVPPEAVEGVPGPELP